MLPAAFRIVEPGLGRAARAKTAARSLRLALTLLAPENGASLSSPPLLKWTAVAKADYYNVQVFRNGHKVMSTWPRASSFRLTRG